MTAAAATAIRVHIGPVKGWIAAGRRTRDFWAGSFLLSWLAGQAMDHLEALQPGAITIPVVHDPEGKVIEPTLSAIALARTSREADEVRSGPLVGTLVNHFRAELPANVPFDGAAMATVVRARFKALADAVWQHFLAPAAEQYGWDADVRRRWDYQTSGAYFEILWVTGTATADWADESRWMEARKSFRSHQPLDETHVGLTGRGDRCPVHPDLCELGGHARMFQREQQDVFWQQLRTSVAQRVYGDTHGRYIETLEIREGERLSGLALVKRLFPLLPAKVISSVIGWLPDHMAGSNVKAASQQWDPLAAQRALRNWPSTAFVAAMPWIIAGGAADHAEMEAYAEAAYRALGFDPRLQAERPQRHRVEGIDLLANSKIPLFAVLDGTLHFPRGLEKQRFGDDAEKARQLAASFDRLAGCISKAAPELGPPAPFYAMLELDGDAMGKVFSASERQAQICSRALLKFADGVPGIVRQHDGVLIYAGADDVTAMLPTATAINCAQAIRAHWQAIMSAAFTDAGPPPTISASIVFADYQAGLNDVRNLTHDRLDQVAKDGMGRDAVALAVLKSGGTTAAWAASWDRPDGTSPVTDVLAFAGQASGRSIASRLPYVLRDRFSAMLAKDATFDDELVAALLAKEMADSGKAGLGERPEDKAEQVMRLLRTWGRTDSDPPASEPRPRHVGGLLVARFLADSVMWPYLNLWQGRQRS